MITRRFLAGCLALATALSPLPAAGQARSIAPPAPSTTPTPLPAINPTQPAPLAAPPVVMPAPTPAPVVSREPARGAESREYSFEDDTVSGDLARPDGAFSAGAAAAPPDVPAYSDLCKASPKPPWCSDAPKGGSGN
jgi:hypothetical protein